MADIHSFYGRLWDITIACVLFESSECQRNPFENIYCKNSSAAFLFGIKCNCMVLSVDVWYCLWMFGILQTIISQILSL